MANPTMKGRVAQPPSPAAHFPFLSPNYGKAVRHRNQSIGENLFHEDAHAHTHTFVVPIDLITFSSQACCSRPSFSRPPHPLPAAQRRSWRLLRARSRVLWPTCRGHGVSNCNVVVSSSKRSIFHLTGSVGSCLCSVVSLDSSCCSSDTLTSLLVSLKRIF
jgi:hypothetical protein